MTERREDNEKGRRGAVDADSFGAVSDKELARRMLRFVLPYKWTFIGALLLLPIVSLLGLVQPQILQTAVDKHFVPQELEGFGWLALLMLAAILGEFAARFGQSILTQIAGEKALRDMRVAVFAHLNRLSVSYFHRNPIGRLMARLTTDVDAISEALSSGVLTIVADSVTLIGIVIILLVKDWKLALVTFTVVPLLLFITRVFRKLLRSAYREARVTLAHLNSYLEESATGMAVIQFFVHEERSRREYDEVNQQYLHSAYRFVGWDSSLYALVEMISSIAIALIIWFGAGQAAQDIVTLGVLIAFIEYAQKFFVPIRDLSQKYTTIQSAFASAERIVHLLDLDEIMPEAPDALPITELKESIEFKNVWFAYHDENWVLRNVSFKLHKGEKIALVGHTGAGKSTIHTLLTRMYDIQKGEILIDGIDIRNYKVHDLRRLFSVVLQDGFLFSGCVRDNIMLGQESITEADIDHACDVVGLDRILARYVDGLDHVVRERGRNMSAGERQIICFARALANRPEVLILDEATANVDTETEHLIQTAVERMLDEQTSIVVAHRLSTIQHADRILVLHHGELVESGSHQELLQQEGLYARLVRLNYASILKSSEPSVP